MGSLFSQQLFIYSSLRKAFHQDIFNYVSQYFNFISIAKVKGILSNLEIGAVATPTSEDHFIKGELYQLKNKDDFSFVFGQLDDYEGLDIVEGEQSYYLRQLTTVYKEDGSVISAWIYWYNGDVNGKPVIESGDILQSPV